MRTLLTLLLASIAFAAAVALAVVVLSIVLFIGIVLFLPLAVELLGQFLRFLGL